VNFSLGLRVAAPSLDPGTVTSKTELPFPNRGTSASAEPLKEYYRPELVIPGRFANGENAAETDISNVKHQPMVKGVRIFALAKIAKLLSTCWRYWLGPF